MDHLTNEQKNRLDKQADEKPDDYLKVIDAYERMKICIGCDKYLAMAKICGVCKCFMPLKTRIKKAKCPLGKW